MSDNPAPETEAELEAFRQKWREEVSARNRRPEPVSTSQTERSQRRPSTIHTSNAPALAPSTARRKEEPHFHEDIAPNSYHDLPNKEDYLKLDSDGQNHDRPSILKEPTSALEHYERAVEKEVHGMLGDSLAHYRKAFKLDDEVDKAYKSKHFPPSAFKKPQPTQPNPSNAPSAMPNPAHHFLHGSSSQTFPSSLQQLVDDFSTLGIEPTPPPTDASPQPPCPISDLPEEILTHILRDLAVTDVTAFVGCAQICKRLAYLVLTEESIWKRITLGLEVGFGAMHYDYVCDIEGFTLDANNEIARYLGSYDDLSDDAAEIQDDADAKLQDRAKAFTTNTNHLLHTTYGSSWRQMFRSRPRIRFNGCYISTVNYTRPGATGGNTLTWGAPVHVVTYFRYLRFFRDGSVISLLTTTEPADVVHHLTKENVHDHHNSTALPSSVMKDALRGRWRLSGPYSSSISPQLNSSITSSPQEEAEGDVFVETEGVVPKYTYKMQLALAHAGKGARNNKLAWKGFWSYNKLTDDWGEFGLRNDRAFYWSRVRSYVT